MKTIITSIFIMMVFIGFKPDENQVISGYVYDQKDKLPLPGAMVYAQSPPQQKTTTNAKGYFKITVSKNEKNLLFSYLGYVTHIEKITANAINIYLQQDSKRLEELVAIGYGTPKEGGFNGKNGHKGLC